MEQIRREIRTYIIDSHWSNQDHQLDDDDSFLELGVLDSLGLLELVSFVEAKYSIHMGHQLSPENLDSIARVASFIERKVAANAGASPIEDEADFVMS